MASDGTPVAEALPSELGNAIAALNTWNNPDLQAKLAELGAPNMGEENAGKKVFQAPCSANSPLASC